MARKKREEAEVEPAVVEYKAVHIDGPKVTILSVTSSRADVTVTYSDGTQDIYEIKHNGSERYIGLR